MSYASYCLLVSLKPLDGGIVSIYVLYNAKRKIFKELFQNF